jgi:hypothetical protein
VFPGCRQVATVGGAADLDEPLRAAAHRADVVAECRTRPARPSLVAEAANHGLIVASRSNGIATGRVGKLSPTEHFVAETSPEADNLYDRRCEPIFSIRRLIERQDLNERSIFVGSWL